MALKYHRSVICVSELTPPGKHGLTEDHTYYYTGLDELHEAWQRLSKDYPYNDLRFAYHHVAPLREMLK